MSEHDSRAADDAQRRPIRSFRGALDLVATAGKEWVEDKCPKQGAALAYYVLFALGPFLLLGISAAALVFGSEAARLAILDSIARLTGQVGAEALEALLVGAVAGHGGYLGLAIGLVSLVVSAAAAFGQLRDALNRVWEVERKTSKGWRAGLAKVVKDNLFSVGALMGALFLIVVSLLLQAALIAIGNRVALMLPGGAIVVAVLNIVLALFVLSGVFALMFKFVPDTRVAWRDVAIGGAITAVLFILGEAAIGTYLGSARLATAYGAASAVLVVLVWIYYTSLVLFFGAEVTQVYANRYGSRVRASRGGVSLREAVARRQGEPEKEGRTGA